MTAQKTHLYFCITISLPPSKKQLLYWDRLYIAERIHKAIRNANAKQCTKRTYCSSLIVAVHRITKRSVDILRQPHDAAEMARCVSTTARDDIISQAMPGMQITSDGG